MLKLCIIGAGQHSQSLHLPSLDHFKANHPGKIELSAIADRDPAKAAEAVAKFGIGHAYDDLDKMLRNERPDACMAFTPVALNGMIATKLMGLGIPVLMEKPLGPTIAEARDVVHVAEETGARIMVSMNRRFDPQVQAALTWIGRRELRYLRATMARHDRHEDRFLEETGVHIIDVIRMVAGEVESWTTRKNTVGGNQWIQVQLEFVSGAFGLVDLLPTTGGNAEILEIFGADFSVEIRSAERDHSWRAWSDGNLVREEITRNDTAPFISNGTYAETVAFIDNVIAGRELHPTPAEVLPGMEICHSIALASSERKFRQAASI